MDSIKKFLSEIKVFDCSGFTKVRIGNKYDGGYVAFKELCEKTTTVYSFGVGDDVGFELDFISQFPQAKVELFDPTIDSLPSKHNNFKFKNQSFSYGVLGYVFTENRALLKVDVEWDEWKGFIDINENNFKNINQILCEFHIVYAEKDINNLTPYFKEFYHSTIEKINNDLFHTYYEVIRKLNKYFYLFHIHANNSLPKTNINGSNFPPLIEMSFVRKGLIKYAPITKGSFPVEGLDYPNKLDRQDIKDWYPLC